MGAVDPRAKVKPFGLLVVYTFYFLLKIKHALYPSASADSLLGVNGMRCVYLMSVSSWKESKNKIIFLEAGRDRLGGVENESKFQRPSEQMLFLNANSPSNHGEVMCYWRMDCNRRFGPVPSFSSYSWENSGEIVKILNQLIFKKLVFHLVGAESSLVSREWLWWVWQELLFQNTQTLNDREEQWYLLVGLIIHLLIYIFGFLFIDLNNWIFKKYLLNSFYIQMLY